MQLSLFHSPQHAANSRLLIRAMLVVGLLIGVLSAREIVAGGCRDENGRPVPCQPEPGGGGEIYNCDSVPDCCAALAACYNTYNSDTRTCSKLGPGAKACMEEATIKYQSCLANARIYECP